MNIKFIPADSKLAESFYDYRQDPITKKYNPLAAATVENLRERLSKASSNFEDYEKSDAFFWFVELDGAVIGNATLQNINRMMLTAEIGYGVFPDTRGKGVATWAVRELTKNAFSQTPLRKLIAFVHEQNQASKKVLEKVGYKAEGLLREHYLVNGDPANEVIYGILRREVI